jgi:hypothetical protein
MSLVSHEFDREGVARRRTHSRRDRRNGAGHPPAQEASANSGEFSGLPRGPSRIAVLATAAMVMGHPALDTMLPPDEAGRMGERLADLLIAHHDTLVVAGWPAVLLGSKHRYIGLAYLAAGQSAAAAVPLARAAEENSEFPVLHTRTRFDLARALVRQPASHHEGATEMKRVEQKAAELGMAGLAGQAAAERDHWSDLEP